MEYYQRSQIEKGATPKKDWFIQFLVNLANKDNFELDITLTVGGVLISGTLTGVRNYFDELGEYFATPFTSDHNGDEVSTIFKEIGERCKCVSPAEQTETPSYIHLKNVTFFNSEGKPMADRSGVWWRGRISEIQGFSPGKLAGSLK